MMSGNNKLAQFVGKLSKMELEKSLLLLAREIGEEKALSMLESSDLFVKTPSNNEKRAEAIIDNSAKRQKRREFNFNDYKQQKIALWVGYFGANYKGLAKSAENDGTVEASLFDALKKVKLIDENSEQEWQYSRCGRTDAGVSGLGQVVSLTVRASNRKITTKQENMETEEEQDDEVDYVKVINSVLPKDIFVFAWSPVKADFNARFMCESRTYRYFFIKRSMMDLSLLNQAAQHLVGKHDFRNFCKMDAENVVSFERTIEAISVNDSNLPNNHVGFVEVKGSAFLWHQIRLIMSILFLVARGLESPDYVKHLLDVNACPRKPPYRMADELPLVLYACEYDEKACALDWKYSKDGLNKVYQKIDKLHTEFTIQQAMSGLFLNRIKQSPFTSDATLTEIQSDFCDACIGKNETYVPLRSKKAMSPTLEEARAKVVAKKGGGGNNNVVLQDVFEE